MASTAFVPLRIVLIGSTGQVGSEVKRRLPPAVPVLGVARGSSGLPAPERRLDVTRLDQLEALIEPGDLVIDCSGPFQGRAQSLLGRARAVLQRGAAWIDVSDDRETVLSFAELNGLAQEQARFAISGAGIFPGLTAPFVRVACEGIRRVNEVQIGWAPGAGLAFGPQAYRDLAQRAGASFEMLLGGERSRRRAFGDRRAFFHPEPHGEVFSYNLDVPDLELFTRPGFKSASVRVSLGTKPLRQRWGLRALARASQGVDPQALVKRLKLLVGRAAVRGGVLTLIVRGQDQAANPQELRQAWVFPGSGLELVASPVIALVRRALEGRLDPGAGPCLGRLEPDELRRELTSVGAVERTGSLGGWRPLAP